MQALHLRRGFHSQVLDEALECLEDVQKQTIWDAISQGVFADVRRARDGGKGFRGVVPRSPGYLNPFLASLETAARQ